MNKNSLKLRELINIPMNGVSLRHQDIAERIAGYKELDILAYG